MSDWNASRDPILAVNARRRAELTPDEVAIYLENGDHITFGSIYREGLQLASALKRLGVGKGDVVSFQLPNWREAVAVDIAVSLLGAVINPVVPIYRDRELTFILADCKAKALFIPSIFRNFNYPEMVSRLRADLPNLEHVIVVRGSSEENGMLAYEDLTSAEAAEDFSPASVDADDVKIIMYTSGTTGNPKAVLHSHKTHMNAVDNGRLGWQLGAGDVMLMPSPVTHITGFANGIELPFFSEARSAFMERWDVDAAIDYIKRVKATACVSATPFLQELVQRSAEKGETLPSMRRFACGGASVPPELIRQTHRVLANCRAFRVYGSTEAPLVTVGFQDPSQEHLAAETDGRIFNWEVRIEDDSGHEQPIGKDGEILVRGPAMMLGYADEEQTREAITNDGFFRTGDIGHITEDGAIVITDRKKDIIIRGGENLSARDIEDVLFSHPAIREAAAVAMPHPRLGEGVCAYVVLKNEGGSLTLEELKPFLEKSGLAKQKWPERVEVVNELPKTASGKVRKDVLRQDIRNRLKNKI